MAVSRVRFDEPGHAKYRALSSRDGRIVELVLKALENLDYSQPVDRILLESSVEGELALIHVDSGLIMGI